MIVSSFNNQAIKNPSPAVRLLKTDFSDVTLGVPVRLSGQNFWQDVNFEATALAKLKSYTGIYTKPFIHCIPDVSCADVTALNARMLHTIETSAKTGGNKDLLQRMLINSGGVPQAPNQLYRYFSDTATIPELPSIYFAYDFIIQSDIITRLSPSGWIMMAEIKEGYKAAPSSGGFRAKCEVLYTGGQLVWNVAGDNNANLIGAPGFPAGSGDSTYPWENVATTYWTNNRIASGVVPVNEWCRMHFEYIRPQSRSDILTGQLNVAIERADGTYQLIHSQKGGIMAGAFMDYMPMTRIMYTNPYSSGTSEIQSRISNLEFWTRAPFNMVAHQL